MKLAARVMLVGAGAVAAAAVAAAPAAAATPAVAPVAETSAAAPSCSASVSGNKVSGTCAVSTPLGTLSATFTGTIAADGTGSGTITLKGGVLGSVSGSWSGGKFTGAQATINYSVPTPLGPINGTITVNL
ncbi:hypothetical protein ACF090_42365 [Streptomyces sp. NPDC014892]|uniref:hypothetical protein n=1 Tax=Streptomyces sp. NPDC014892 TaxID=3364930 RepID=UPI0036FEF920